MSRSSSLSFRGRFRRNRIGHLAFRPHVLLDRPVSSVVEVLEQRTLLSTVVVTNNADSGPGSLRDAIANAASGDTIVFADSVKNETITLSSGELPIGKGLNIEGPGANHLTISGNNASRVFDVSGSGNVTIAGLTITDGVATIGGGAVNEGGGTLSISNCALSGDRAISNAGSGGTGGAIEDLQGTLNVANCTFNNDKAIAAGPNFPAFPGTIFALGGAIDVSINDTGPATITNSTFTGNQALGGAPGGEGGGGAISNTSFHGAVLTVVGCAITDNAAIGAAGGDGVTTFGFGQAGGVNSFSTLVVRDSTLTDNLALGAPLAPGAVPSQTISGGTAAGGGAIYYSSSNPMILSDSTLTGNQAVGGAGAPGSAGNGATGGAILMSNGSGSVMGCRIDDNVALGGPGGSGGIGGPGVSGGIDLEFGASLTVTNSELNHNQAIGGAGGTGAVAGDGVGGAIDVGSGVVFGSVSDNCSLTVNNCTLDHNQAAGGTGSAGSSGGNATGGGLSVLAGSSATVNNTSISHNSATGGDGANATSTSAGGNGLGGGVYVGTGATVTIATGVITANQAIGGQGHHAPAGQGIGGGVYNLGSFSQVALTLILGNHASINNDNIFP